MENSSLLSRYQFYVFDKEKLIQFYEKVKNIEESHELFIPIIDSLVSDIENKYFESNLEMYSFFMSHTILDLKTILKINAGKLISIKSKLINNEVLNKSEVRYILTKASIKFCSPDGASIWPFEDSICRTSQSFSNDFSNEVALAIRSTVMPSDQNVDMIYFLLGLEFADFNHDTLQLFRGFFPKYRQFTF